MKLVQSLLTVKWYATRLDFAEPGLPDIEMTPRTCCVIRWMRSQVQTWLNVFSDMTKSRLTLMFSWWRIAMISEFMSWWTETVQRFTNSLTHWHLTTSWAEEIVYDNISVMYSGSRTFTDRDGSERVTRSFLIELRHRWQRKLKRHGWVLVPARAKLPSVEVHISKIDVSGNNDWWVKMCSVWHQIRKRLQVACDARSRIWPVIGDLNSPNICMIACACCIDVWCVWYLILVPCLRVSERQTDMSSKQSENFQIGFEVWWGFVSSTNNNN